MKTEFIPQYEHTWRVFERVVNDFDPDAWLHTGRGAIRPARLSLHILQAVSGYIEDTSITAFPSGKSFTARWETADEADLPAQADITACIHTLCELTNRWLSEMDPAAHNQTFPWAGQTRLGVVIFLLRHTLFHLGELSSLLNESKLGQVEDHYVKAIG